MHNFNKNDSAARERFNFPFRSHEKSMPTMATDLSRIKQILSRGFANSQGKVKRKLGVNNAFVQRFNYARPSLAPSRTPPAFSRNRTPACAPLLCPARARFG